MGSYAVFLRGINAGGINIKMADLREEAVKRESEKCLRDTFGYDAWAVVLKSARLSELVATCPYPEDDKTTHSYITLASDTGVLDERDAAGAALEGNEQERLGPETLAWLAPAGGTLDSPFSRISSKAKFKAATTTRNLRTLIKVRDVAAELAATGG